MDDGSYGGGADEYKENEKENLLDADGQMHCMQTHWHANADVLDAAGG